MLRALLLILLVCGGLADCPLNPYPRRTVIGYLEALLNNDPNLHTTPQDYIYSLDEEFQSNRISVALGVVGLDLNAHGRINFSIEHVATSRVDSLKFQVVAKDGEWGWRKMRFNFLATTQDSLFQASSETVTQFSVGLEKGRYALYRALPNINNFNLEPIVRVFLSGVDLAALPLELDSEYQTMLQQYTAFKSFSTNIVLINYFEQAIEDKKSVQLSLSGAKILSRFLTFSITTNADLKLIRYSYILFSNQALIGKHHYILGDFELLNNVKHSITPLSNMGMLMTGLTSFHIPRSQSYQLNLAFDSYFGQGYFQAKTSHAFLPLNFTFLAMEMMQKFVCEDCPDNASIIYDNKYCVQACPRGFSISSRLENSYCDKCDVQKLKVVDPSTGNCVCARRHYWNQTEDTCKPCSYDCMTCSQENQCLSCDNPLMQTGRKINAQGRCSCPPTGFYDDKAAEDIVCHPCSSYCLTCSGPRSHDCLTCTTGKELDSQGHCVCSNHYVETRPGVCSCPAPRIIFKGFCVDPNETCGENQVQQFVNVIQKCVCVPGTYQVLNKCIKCPTNAVFDAANLKCKCVNSMIEVNGACVPCGTNQVYDSASNLCVCKLGTFKSESGSCISCPAKMAYINGNCECIFNYFESSVGVCSRCLRESDGPKCRRNVF